MLISFSKQWERLILFNW